MAWTEYAAVRSSTVYENKGIAKSLLLMVTWLIERAEEDEQPGEHEGYCYASVKYLAESLGCSESAVEKWIDRFVADGWISKETSRDKNGHLHNRYCLAPGALGRLADLKRVRGEERPKNTNKSRPSRSERVGGKFASGSPAGTTRASRVSDGRQAARSGKANRNGAGQPSRSERNPYPLGAGECVVDLFLDEFCDELEQNAGTQQQTCFARPLRGDTGRPCEPLTGLCPEPSRRGFSPPDPSAADSCQLVGTAADPQFRRPP